MAVAESLLKIKILADVAQATASLDKASGKTSKWASGMNKAAGVAKVGLLAVGAVVADGIKGAAEDAQAQAVLANALKKSAGATDAAVSSTEDWISKTSMATGVADDQLRPALATLARATGSVEESQKAMGLALDISAATGKDVESVSAALAKGYAGQTTAIGRLVPGMDKAVLASGDMAKVSDELASKVGGSAAAAADTAAGKYKIMAVGMGELKEGIGAALLPVITTLATKMAGIANWAQRNQQMVNILVGVFAALAGIIITVNAATKLYTTYQKLAAAASKIWAAMTWLVNAAMSANPLALVVIAVIALIAAIVIAYKKSDTFRRIVDAAFHAVLNAAKAAWQWIKSNWPTLVAIITGPIGIAVLAVVKNWSKIKAAAQAVFSWLRGAWSDVVGAIKRVAGTLAAPIVRAWDAVRSAIQGVIDLVSNLISKIAGIHFPKVPDLNPFAATAPAAAGRTVAGAQVGLTRGVATRGATSARGVVINVNGALDPESVARQIRAILRGHDIRVGKTAGVVGV